MESLFASVFFGDGAVAVVGVGIEYSSWITASHWCGSTTFCKPTTIFQPKVLILACCIGLFSNWNGALSFGVESVDLYSLLGSFKVVFLTFLLLNFRMCIVWENLQIERMTILVLSFQQLIRYCSKPSQNRWKRWAAAHVVKLRRNTFVDRSQNIFNHAPSVKGFQLFNCKLICWRNVIGVTANLTLNGS